MQMPPRAGQECATSSGLKLQNDTMMAENHRRVLQDQGDTLASKRRDTPRAQSEARAREGGGMYASQVAISRHTEMA